jgi:hypothetical protein
MAPEGKIEDRRLTELFDELITKKVIISMHVVGTSVDRLTCVTGIIEGSDGNHLLIDPPRDFEDIATAKDLWHLRFTFIGPDRLEYIFSTRGGVYHGQNLKIPFPENVERMQRRRNFRVDTLPGSRLHFQINKIQGTIDLINISRGGAYGVLTKTNFKFVRGSIMKSDQQLYQVKMVFPGDEGGPDTTIHVRRAGVKRVERDQDRGYYRYAIEFKEIEKEALQQLTQTIYEIQRIYLRRRK